MSLSEDERKRQNLVLDQMFSNMPELDGQLESLVAHRKKLGDLGVSAGDLASKNFTY